MRLTRTAAVLDIASVVIFVVIGRASHVKGESLAGIASTSWPFLCGLAAGWALSRAWPGSAASGWPAAVRPAGVIVWACTVALGMVLRVVSGQGTAAAFVVVALVFLGLFLLGWRLAARLVTRPGGSGRLRRWPSRAN
ncbi:MAG TPA: DUF3054 domain-containing protein [Trebonia sp.]|jgi:hypothetical protein|nr:DUF3054 domain-containing protein [Trebonia sp.]